MSVVPVPIEGFDFAYHEYVWDRVWKGPAIVVGVLKGTNRLTVAEIVQPAKLLGRAAHRDPRELCRYVKLIVPEDELGPVDSALLYVATHTPVSSFGEPLTSFRRRLIDASEARGLTTE